MMRTILAALLISVLTFLPVAGAEPKAPKLLELRRQQVGEIAYFHVKFERPANLRPVNVNNNVVHTQWGNIELDEFASWSRLFRGYCDFYEWPTSDEHQEKIWGWIHDERCVEALVAVRFLDDTEVGDLEGLAHLREWVRPLRASRCGYLDDLFVAPAARGTGAVEALFAEMRRRGAARQWSVIRWTTAATNARAQRTYDRVAERTSWVTYDMAITSAPDSAGAPVV